MINIVSKIENIFATFIKGTMYQAGVRKRLINICERKLSDQYDCTAGLQIIISKYIIMRLHYFCKFHNQAISCKKRQRKLDCDDDEEYQLPPKKNRKLQILRQ